MIYDLQKASMWKRISAFLFDGILLSVVIVAAAFLLSSVLGYDGYSRNMEAAYARYEAEYGITFQITEEEYGALSEEELENYNAAYAALIADTDAMYNYNMVINLTMIIVSVGALLGFIAMEFVIPMLFGNGQTLGKKIFGIGLVRKDGVKVNGLQMFTRAVLGKFAVETMIPVYILILIFFNAMGLTGTIILLGLGLLQIILVCATRTNSTLHDIIAGTVAVDMASQMIFRSTEDLIAYQKKVAAEKAARQQY